MGCIIVVSIACMCNFSNLLGEAVAIMQCVKDKIGLVKRHGYYYRERI